jgi:hypothetical protein
MDTSERRSPHLSLSAFSVPRYRYFPTALINKCGPEQWERMRILQACERLEIPTKLWPKVPFPQIPRQMAVRMFIPNRPDKLDLPPFLPLEESISEWRRRCHVAFDKTLEEYATKFGDMFEDSLKQGLYTKLPQMRETTDVNLRYEWAAKRFCYRTPYKKLANAARGYSDERIKQSVLQILKKAGLSEGK